MMLYAVGHTAVLFITSLSAGVATASRRMSAHGGFTSRALQTAFLSSPERARSPTDFVSSEPVRRFLEDHGGVLLRHPASIPDKRELEFEAGP
jgi:hypothetical protein